MQTKQKPIVSIPVTIQNDERSKELRPMYFVLDDFSYVDPRYKNGSTAMASMSLPPDAPVAVEAKLSRKRRHQRGKHNV